MKLLAMDLETVLDADAGRRAFGLSGTDLEVRALMRARRLADSDGRTDFCKPAFHRIVAIGAVVIDTLKGKVKLVSDAGNMEGALLDVATLLIGRRPAPLVTWGGSNFDLPVLRYRALLHGLNLSSLYGAPDAKRFDSYLYRYSDSHIDLMEVLDGYGASTPLKLSEAAALCGLPCKTLTDGSGVEDLVEAGAWPALESYVLEDALDTTLLFLRWELTRNRLAVEACRDILAKIVDELQLEHVAVEAAIKAWLKAPPFALPVPVAAPAEPEFALGAA